MNYIGAIRSGDILGEEKGFGLTATFAFCALFISCWAFWALHLFSPNTSPYAVWDFSVKNFTSRQFCPFSCIPETQSAQLAGACSYPVVQTFQNDKSQIVWLIFQHGCSFSADAAQTVQSNTIRKLDDIIWKNAKDVFISQSRDYYSDYHSITLRTLFGFHPV